MNIKMVEFGRTSASVLYEDIDCVFNELLYIVYFGGNYNKKILKEKLK